MVLLLCLLTGGLKPSRVLRLVRATCSPGRGPSIGFGCLQCTLSHYEKEQGLSEGGAAQVREQARKGYFDRFAQRCAESVSKAPFFTFCVALVVVWVPTFLFTDLDTW